MRAITKLITIGLLVLFVAGAVYAATKYRARCYTEAKWLGEWNTRKELAENRIKIHRSNYPNHRAGIETK